MCRKLSQFENTIRQRKETAIIIPAFNEEANIRGMLEKVKKIMTPSIELLVVDDGSVDSTKEILKKLNISYISMGFNSGYGAALQTGVKYAERNGFEYVVLMDAD
ncbi:MAG: glycosyltransferase family 2 protein, partial [Candidatus Omnitrophica bacterium]|nr:glycosyltransferase family 2 protein [Candidatus Omnitrophota bacterium]